MNGLPPCPSTLGAVQQFLVGQPAGDDSSYGPLVLSAVDSWRYVSNDNGVPHWRIRVVQENLPEWVQHYSRRRQLRPFNNEIIVSGGVALLRLVT